ncbi:MAG: DUF3459 domain-containing protein [Chloroflexi bacterium]|nr:DUF3459 domain-containing protein [Chloroflexota bacterium]
MGERLSQIVSYEAQKLAAAVVMLSPFIPLLFMGEEYGEKAPFQYFVSHSDPDLVDAVRRGRRGEFADFHWQSELPDPQDEATFLRSRLDYSLRGQGHHRALLAFYRELIRLRKELPPLASLRKDTLEVVPDMEQQVLVLRRWSNEGQIVAAFNFSGTANSAVLPVPHGPWHKLMDSSEEQWLGPGSTAPSEIASMEDVRVDLSPWAAILYVRE